MEKLIAGVANPGASLTLASSVAMRNLRIDVIGTLWKALEGYADEELCTVTVVKNAWVITPSDLLTLDARTIKEHFLQDLKRTGVTAHGDPLVGFLHGEFEPTRGVFVLHFHLVTTRDKAARLARGLRGLPRAYRPSESVPRPIRCSKLKERLDKLLIPFKRFGRSAR